MCKKNKQTSVSNSSAESEVIFAWTVSSLSISGIWFFEVLHTFKKTTSTARPVRRNPTETFATGRDVNKDNVELFSVDHVTTNAKLSHFDALFNFF